MVTISHFGDRFRGGQYTLVSFLFAYLNFIFRFLSMVHEYAYLLMNTFGNRSIMILSFRLCFI